MKLKFKIGLILISAITLVGCLKEVSLESGGTIIVIGPNCRIKQISVCDTTTKQGIASFQAIFGAQDRVIRIEGFDSLFAQTFFAENLSYSGDTIRIDANQFFVLDPQGRVNKFFTLDDPSDPTSDSVRYTYSYNAGGFLIGKTVEVEGLAGIFLATTYTYAGNNLIKAEVRIPLLGNALFIEADMEYFTSNTVRNFLYFFPDGIETAPFELALNLGNRSQNALKTMTIKEYDPFTGLVENTFITNISNYKFSSDNYVLSYFVSGDPFDEILLFAEGNKLTYKCP